MAYYPGAPGGYGQQPGYGGYPGQASSPTGMAPGMVPGMVPGMPPGMGGMGGPPGAPGMYQSQHPLPARPGAMPPGFSAPQNMPKFDLNAPVIRLGTVGTPKDNNMGNQRAGSNTEPLGARRGIGMDRNIEQQRAQIRETMMALQPPKPDEILKTIFVGNITEGCGGDAGVEAILRCAGNLRKWIRAIDADNKLCTFGFAEYEDSESLETAAAILEDVYVPIKKQQPKKQNQENGDTNGNADDEVEKVKLLVIIDQASTDYAAMWSKQRGDSEETIEFRHEGARQALAGVIKRLTHPTEEHDFEFDSAMQETAQTQDPLTGEVITISLDKTEDELSDIPAEMRETVAAEIAAFRERSIRRDLERLKREEDMEARERGSRAQRHGTPPHSAPTGPGGANGIPVGPRGMQGAPSGPKGLRGGGGVQIPKDYQNGVSFTQGSSELRSYLGNEDDDTDASDEELERRRHEKKEADQEKAYLDYERRWQNRERARAAALERERRKDESEESRKQSDAKSMAKQQREWNDETEERRRTHEYYANHSLWVRDRLAFRQREATADAADRRAEDEEKRSARAAEDQARGLADSFLDRQAEELGARGIGSQPRFKISLGAAAQKAQQAQAPKKNAVDVENILDVDETAGGEESKRELIPIKFDTLAEAAALTPEERQEALKQVALTVPQDKEGLFAWDVKWAGLSADVMRQLKDWVESRSMDNFGVVEELMWDVVQEVLKAKKRDSPTELIENLKGLLEDETDSFVRKLWRMVVFLTECEVKGLNKERSD